VVFPEQQTNPEQCIKFIQNTTIVGNMTKLCITPHEKAPASEETGAFERSRIISFQVPPQNRPCQG
jgi:hypothetical protein